MTILTIGVPRITWLSLVTPDVNSIDLSRELGHSEPGENVVILGFTNDAPQTALIIEEIPAESVMNTISFVATDPHYIVEQFVEETPRGHFLQEFQGMRRIIMPYKIGAFMAALWGLGIAWEVGFTAEWEILMTAQPLLVGQSISHMSTLLHYVFQNELNNDSAPQIADALSKIVELAQYYNAASAAVDRLD